MHTPQEDKCCLLPQPKLVPTEEGEGEGEEPLLNKMANQWMSTRNLMKVCAVCVCVCVCCLIRLQEGNPLTTQLPFPHAQIAFTPA